MRILAPKQVIFYTLSLLITSCYLHAQDAKVRVSQDPKFEQLLNDKRKSNVSAPVNDRYKIQIFSGDSENAKKTLRSFKQEFTDTDGTIVFNTPNYKVWVGNFKTRIEAERNLVDIRKKYKNILLIKPSK
ncbi:SPOR domain-containing protein [Flavobacterium sp. LS2P90]|uniref:SPOR domain-containing protein n=1 Tax=Flavobacterium xylosi TaxID=3230415 RepID=A0ABW6HRY6_9FLAO